MPTSVLANLTTFFGCSKCARSESKAADDGECGPREKTGDANFSLTMEYKELLIRFSSSAEEFAVMNYAVHIMK